METDWVYGAFVFSLCVIFVIVCTAPYLMAINAKRKKRPSRQIPAYYAYDEDELEAVAILDSIPHD